MSDLMEKALAVVGRWPASRQDEAAELLLALDRLGATYTASPEELAAMTRAWRKPSAAASPATPKSKRRFNASVDEGPL